MEPQYIQRTIVAGIDRTEADAEVLSAAIVQARAVHGRVVIIHALDAAKAVAAFPSDCEAHRRHVAADIRRQVGKLFRDGMPDILLEIVVAWGGAATLILGAALNASMIVVGTHGSRHTGALLLGTVSQDVAVHASCPVLLVPTDQAHLADIADVS